jgi:hypothetical protein
MLFLYWPALLGGIGLEDAQSELRYSLRAFEMSSSWTTAPAKPKRNCISTQSIVLKPPLQQPKAGQLPPQPQLLPLQQNPTQSAQQPAQHTMPGTYLDQQLCAYPMQLGLQPVTVVNDAEAKLRSWKMSMRRWLSVATKPVRCGKGAPKLLAPLDRCREDYSSGQLEELSCILAEMECTYGTATLLPPGLEPIWLLKRIRGSQKNAQNIEEEWIDVTANSNAD